MPVSRGAPVQLQGAEMARLRRVERLAQRVGRRSLLAGEARRKVEKDASDSKSSSIGTLKKESLARSAAGTSSHHSLGSCKFISHPKRRLSGTDPGIFHSSRRLSLASSSASGRAAATWGSAASEGQAGE